MGIFTRKKYLSTIDIACKLSTEMIEPQLNDPVVDDIRNTITNIRNIIKQENIVNFNFLLKNDKIRLAYEKLDDIIYKRFGIAVRHKFISGMYPYGIMAVMPFNLSVLNENIEEIYKQIKSYLKYTESDKNNKKEETIKFDSYKVLQTLMENVKLLDKQLSNSNVIIDLHSATIKNLPNDFVVDIITNPLFLFSKDLNLTDNEITAIILHEIGHQFTFIENSYRTVRNTTTLLTTLHESIKIKGKDVKESLILAYEKTYNEKLENTFLPTNVVFITVSTKHILETFKLSDYNGATTDKEALADQFASRFGVGADLITSIDKISKVFESSYFFTKIDIANDNTTLSLLFVFTILLIIGGGLPIIFAAAIQMLIILLVATFILYIVNLYNTDGGTNASLEYDVLKKRLTRIRIDAIRILQTINDKDLVKNYIKKIEDMDRIINMIPDESPDIFARIIRFIKRNRANRYIELRDITDLIEKLQANDLFLASAKLKTL